MVETIRPVRAMKLGDLTGVKGRQFPGRAAARDEVDLSFQVSGPLISFPVEVGDTVRKGDVIAVIDPRDFQVALASAQGNLERARANLSAMETGARPEEIEQLKSAVAEAEATHQQAVLEFDREKRLMERQATTQQDYEIAEARAARTEAQLATAKESLNIGMKGARPEDLEAKRSEIRALEAAVSAAQNQLDDSVLHSPFGGEIAATYVENFQTVQTEQPIVRLLDLSRIEITIQIPESVIPLVPLVKQVSCHFDAFADREFVGHVTKIGSEASQTTRTFPVTVEIDQPEDVRILPGMAATVQNKPEEGEKADEGAIIVPPAAIFAAETGQENFVWIVPEGGGEVTRREIQVGELTPFGLTVVEGLERGEWVITSGVNSLRESQKVTILNEGGK
ncbi:efflux RND transporter periplasmic adaptor subunit [Thalassoglobus sp. JC818]|uniref:efflux RND transporter periplasmic adaptor subunit n=1 Tax=Thalassoglobus sp. JC818 TaxID=3232136 RepID=UPI00345929E3